MPIDAQVITSVIFFLLRWTIVFIRFSKKFKITPIKGRLIFPNVPRQYTYMPRENLGAVKIKYTYKRQIYFHFREQYTFIVC